MAIKVSERKKKSHNDSFILLPFISAATLLSLVAAYGLIKSWVRESLIINIFLSFTIAEVQFFSGIENKGWKLGVLNFMNFIVRSSECKQI